MVRPNPRYQTEQKKIAQIEEMILLNEGITVEDPKQGILIDEFVSVSGGYNRNFALEKRIIDELGRVEQYKTKFKGVMNPVQIPEPSYWATSKHGWREDYPNDTDALEYLERSKALEQALIDLWDYKCNSYPRDTNYCQNAAQRKGTVNRINALIGLVQASIKESEFKFPEIFPQVFAEEEPLIKQSTPSNQVTQILNDINNNVIQVPDWFRNNIEWVQSGHINEQEFLTAYNYLVDQQIAHAPVTQDLVTQAPVNESITDNMITQKIDYFTIENGRAIGQITFTATQNFNPFYYNKTITNLIQFKDRNGVNILPTVKQNNLRFTATERDETIQFDEGMQDNIYSKVSSFVWSSATTPTAFSKPSEFEIREKEPVKPISSGFMAAGVAGAIAGLILIGFIADHRGGKR